ncbi:hypothetical protein [Streptomyces niveus]|uniref:hypothetical protein n=1 Tax=Streptomyces niveus TaxID=193462 RepID=UPI0036356AAE
MTTDESDFSSLERVLADVVDSAGVAGLVSRRRAGEDVILVLRLIGSRRLPFPLTTEAAAAWLETAGVYATVDYQDTYLVISLRDKRSVDQLVERLLGPFMYTESVRERLQDALEQHRLRALVSLPNSGSMVLALRDSENLGRAVRLGAVLGAAPDKEAGWPRRDAPGHPGSSALVAEKLFEELPRSLPGGSFGGSPRDGALQS